ncbi:chaperone modulatory protein CbpM [Paracoccus sediminis]|uniref:Chaperone modulatory protein CbpM n=2 Tax=Paracoccus sediminis TaxID=1214787 RepID=A0A238W0E2_9RHOB|nr:chaperone modulatory protein CbpM [Paracoccus sediminis]
MIRAPGWRRGGKRMARHYSETDVVAILDDLDPARLRSFVAAHVVTPVVTPQGHAFTEADVARLQLLCDLSDVYDLPNDVLVMVMSLIDQLNTARGDMRALIQAVATEPDDVRGRIITHVRNVRVIVRD